MRRKAVDQGTEVVQVTSNPLGTLRDKDIAKDIRTHMMHAQVPQQIISIRYAPLNPEINQGIIQKLSRT